MKALFFALWLALAGRSMADDHRLTIINGTSSNVVVGGLTVLSGNRLEARLPETFGPFQMNFGGTNYEFGFLSDRVLILGENLMETREEWSLLQYFWLGFTTLGGFSLSGWGVVFLRKLSRQSAEL